MAKKKSDPNSRWKQYVKRMSPLEKLTFIATTRCRNRDRKHRMKLVNLMRQIKAEIEKRRVQVNTSMDALVAVAELWEELQPTQDADVPRGSYASALK